MPSVAYALPQRGFVEVKGPDAAVFLQGLITNDVGRADGNTVVYAALLTPQGKVIGDFLIVGTDDGYLLDCVGARAADLTARLKKYKLRAKVEVADRSADFEVYAVTGDAKIDSAIADPRFEGLGRRVVGSRGTVEAKLKAAGATIEDADAYAAFRMQLGVPDSETDIPPESLFPLDCNFEELHGVDFKKGCYVGQELTARMKHRATARKRLLPVSAVVELPAPGTRVTVGATEVGEMRGSLDRNGLALIRLDRLHGATEALADGVTLTIGMPAYPLILPQGDHET